MPEIDHSRRRPSRLAGLATRALNEGELDDETTPAIPLKDTPSTEPSPAALQALPAEPRVTQLDRGVVDDVVTSPPLNDTPSTAPLVPAPFQALSAEPSANQLDRGVVDDDVTSPPPLSKSAAISRGVPRSRQPKTILTVSLPTGIAGALRTAAQHERLAFADIVMDAYNGHADALEGARWRRPEAGRLKLNLAVLMSDADELNRLADRHGRPLSTVIAALLELHLGTNQH
jgi:hypothetical protein